MLVAAVVAVCVALSAATDPLPEKIHYDVENAANLFKAHVIKYNRKYNVEEYNKRLEIFKQSLKKINELNTEFPQTVFGVNRLADLTPEELKSYHGVRRGAKNEDIMLNLNVKMKPAPDAFDWRDHNAVTPVMHQGNCGSCYIFSAIGNIEGQYAIKHNQCIAFSKQQVLDCIDPQRKGCEGGWADEVIIAFAQNYGSKGCMTEEDYPYLGKQNMTCKEKSDKIVAKVTGGGRFNVTDAEDLKQKLYNIGPIAISLDSNDFDYYEGGVLHPKVCSDIYGGDDHAVLLVGYGTEKGEKYWIIKNSWGDDWGEKGYVRLLRGVNACGVEADRFSTAIVD